MKYCKKCLQPDTRPGVYFNEAGVCGACLAEEGKPQTDWNKRYEELEELAKWAKEESLRRNIPYHCTIGVSGGKDSIFQAIYMKEKLGLRPLLVNCVPDSLTETGRKNMNNLSSHGFDTVQIKLDPKVAKALARKSFYEFGNIMKASEYCLWASSFRIAYQFNVPLNVLGENPAITLGTSVGMNTDGNAFGVFNMNTLQGGGTDIWVGDGVSKDDLFFYGHPSKEEMEKKNIRAIYLGYYAKEWSQVGNADFAIARGLMGRTSEDLHDIGRYRRYTALDSDDTIVNQMLKYLKFGFGFATDEACYDIREGRLTREDAVWHVKEYDGKCGKRYIQDICEYLDITEEEFWRVADGFVNKDLFIRGEGKERWVPKFTVGEDFL